MPHYLVAIHHPDGYDGSLEGEAMERDIDVLNEEMEAAGARIFAGGLSGDSSARSLRARPDGKVLVTDGPYPGDQGARRRLLDTESREPGRGSGVGPQGRRRLSGPRRGAPVPLTRQKNGQLSIFGLPNDYLITER